MVYVDSAKAVLGRMKMCHMIADSEDELHLMAHKLGLRFGWFQNKRIPHYDICKSKRKRAIELGAIEISSRTLVSKALKLS